MPRIFRVFALLFVTGVPFASWPAGAQTGNVPVTLDNLRQFGSPDVVDPSATLMGTLVRVKTDSDGKVQRVMVMLSTAEGQGRVASIPPERLSIDKARRVVVANFTTAELLQLASTATTPTGSIIINHSLGVVHRYSGDQGFKLPRGGVLLPMAHC